MSLGFDWRVGPQPSDRRSGIVGARPVTHGQPVAFDRSDTDGRHIIEPADPYAPPSPLGGIVDNPARDAWIPPGTGVVFVGSKGPKAAMWIEADVEPMHAVGELASAVPMLDPACASALRSGSYLTPGTATPAGGLWTASDRQDLGWLRVLTWDPARFLVEAVITMGSP